MIDRLVSGRARHRETVRPVGGETGVGLMLGLFVERSLQHAQQALCFGEVALLRAPDRQLGQVVAQHELWIHASHALAALGVAAVLVAQALRIARAPGVEGRAVDEEVAYALVGRAGVARKL